MHTRVTRYELRPGKTAEALQLVREHWIDQIARAEGFVSFEMLETDTDELVGILTFDTEEQSMSALEAAREWVFRHFGDLLVSPSEVIMGEVKISTFRD